MAIYHLNVSHGSRAGGQSAVAKCDYILRQGKRADRADLAACGSRSLPGGVSASEFWAACDDYSRANGRLFTELEMALPKELSRPQQLDLVRKMLDQIGVVDSGNVPLTWGLHDKGDGNVHIHVQLSSRIDDGAVRPDMATWFKRAHSKDPAKGGARSWAEKTDKDWLEGVRARWAELVNQALASASSKERVDHRSHATRGIALAPTKHVGWRRGRRRRETLEHNKRVAEANEEYVRLERQLRALRAQDAVEQAEAEAEAAAKIAKQFRENNLARAAALEKAQGLTRLREAEALLLMSAETVRPVPHTTALTEPRPHFDPEFVVKSGQWGKLYIRMPADQLAMLDTGMRIKVQAGHDHQTRLATLRLSASRWAAFEIKCPPEVRDAWWQAALELGVQHCLRFEDPPDGGGGGQNTPDNPHSRSRARLG